jgi:hypothetical protein
MTMQLHPCWHTWKHRFTSLRKRLQMRMPNHKAETPLVRFVVDFLLYDMLYSKSTTNPQLSTSPTTCCTPNPQQLHNEPNKWSLSLIPYRCVDGNRQNDRPSRCAYLPQRRLVLTSENGVTSVKSQGSRTQPR